jgi:hypothetical protein
MTARHPLTYHNARSAAPPVIDLPAVSYIRHRCGGAAPEAGVGVAVRDAFAH